jgi:hypothetical protein
MPATARYSTITPSLSLRQRRWRRCTWGGIWLAPPYFGNDKNRRSVPLLSHTPKTQLQPLTQTRNCGKVCFLWRNFFWRGLWIRVRLGHIERPCGLPTPRLETPWASPFPIHDLFDAKVLDSPAPDEDAQNSKTENPHLGSRCCCCRRRRSVPPLIDPPPTFHHDGLFHLLLLLLLLDAVTASAVAVQQQAGCRDLSGLLHLRHRCNTSR